MRKIPTLNFHLGKKQENIVFCCACWPRLYIFVPDTQYTVDLSSHIAYLISHTRGRIHIFYFARHQCDCNYSIGQDIQWFWLNPCIALDQGTFAFFFSLTLSLIIIGLTLSKVKLSLSSFSNIQHPSAWVSIVKWWYLGERFHFFLQKKKHFSGLMNHPYSKQLSS